MRFHRLFILLLPIGLIALAIAMTAAASTQRDATTHAADRTEAAAQMLIGTLDKETGLRGYLLNGRDGFLEPYRQGRAAERTAAARVAELSRGDRQVSGHLARIAAATERWNRAADEQVRRKRAERGDYFGDTSEALGRKELMDQVRLGNAVLQDRLVELRDAEVRAASTRATATTAIIILLIGIAALLMRRADVRQRAEIAAADAACHDTQREFTEVIQVVDSERSAHEVLKRHLELRLAGDTSVTILDHNVADDCLEATTPVAEDSVLHARIEGAEPSSCLAVRLARPYRDDGTERGLITCELCGHDGPAACQPLLVGGQVIGSVLAELAEPVDEVADRRIQESVALAAPVLANLRTLREAERRASTDALTGLPNRRTFEDTLTRMSAQSVRSGQSLAAIAFDLDRFKDINDRFGHDMGDIVLIAAARVVTGAMRASDFCARVGGEEFVVLAPDTGLDGAKQLAEKLRSAFEREQINGLDRRVTASFGIATLPGHTSEPATLMRMSDAALYAAKSGGRNQVAVAEFVG